MCLTYDSGFTERVYDSKGLMGAAGNGRRLRLSQAFNPNTEKCSLLLEDQAVSRTVLSKVMKDSHAQ